MENQLPYQDQEPSQDFLVRPESYWLSQDVLGFSKKILAVYCLLLVG